MLRELNSILGAKKFRMQTCAFFPDELLRPCTRLSYSVARMGAHSLLSAAWLFDVSHRRPSRWVPVHAIIVFRRAHGRSLAALGHRPDCSSFRISHNGLSRWAPVHTSRTSVPMAARGCSVARRASIFRSDSALCHCRVHINAPCRVVDDRNSIRNNIHLSYLAHTFKQKVLINTMYAVA